MSEVPLYPSTSALHPGVHSSIDATHLPPLEKLQGYLRRRRRSFQLLEFAPLGLLGLREPGQFRREQPTGGRNFLTMVAQAPPRRIAPSRRGAGCRHSKPPNSQVMSLPNPLGGS